MEAATTRKLKHDLQAVVVDAEELLKATAAQTGERIEKVRARAEESLRAARQRLDDAGAAVAQRAEDAANNVDDQVHKHPWASAGIAACAGLAIGILIARR